MTTRQDFLRAAAEHISELVRRRGGLGQSRFAIQNEVWMRSKELLREGGHDQRHEGEFHDAVRRNAALLPHHRAALSERYLEEAPSCS